MERAEAIVYLKHMVKIHEKLKIMDLHNGAQLGDEYIDKRIMALKIAIHSLEVDEKYGLLYMETTHKEAADDHQEGEL